MDIVDELDDDCGRTCVVRTVQAPESNKIDVDHTFVHEGRYPRPNVLYLVADFCQQLSGERLR